MEPSHHRQVLQLALGVYGCRPAGEGDEDPQGTKKRNKKQLRELGCRTGWIPETASCYKHKEDELEGFFTYTS
jgi:hypothetical protein